LKVLLDTCLSVQAWEALKAAGHDAIWGGIWEKDPDDDAILDLAFKEGRVLITLDKDFGGLAVLRGAAHCGIVRLVNFNVSQQAPACLKILADYSEDLSEGALITAEPGRIRIRQTMGR
jgi:predicted nuclease of predicted toxin-antitoxin system